MDRFKIDKLGLDPIRKMNFEEYLEFKVSSGRPFRFSEFHHHCGISRQQWDVFKMENRELEIDWVIE